ncbi:hypothetical protein P152DRAFT_18692 [Eremomyces bilateralis CBS 781.70]|uniref:Uncharacterized protein n=1 Tax=Eremomyces bilateralis CBS 781.70 TaxID=1392243 RepID=A0A6G1GHK4_9PEZI|nr:uncharacterized protein P152DRAFT_18692 [Eremomyces bilateralis CBS 781.70]KAF1817426.1 hypothetical protein P152DRAFT_18692 [Eremomyces bilateralis CBS 781.70]
MPNRSQPSHAGYRYHQSTALNIHASDCLDCRVKFWQLECAQQEEKAEKGSAKAKIVRWLQRVEDNANPQKAWDAFGRWETPLLTAPDSPSLSVILKRRHSKLSKGRPGSHQDELLIFPRLRSDRNSLRSKPSDGSIGTTGGSTQPGSTYRASSSATSSEAQEKYGEPPQMRHRSVRALQAAPSDPTESPDSELMLRTPEDHHHWRSLRAVDCSSSNSVRYSNRKRRPMERDGDATGTTKPGRFVMSQIKWALINLRVCQTTDLTMSLPEVSRKRAQYAMCWNPLIGDIRIKKNRSGPPHPRRIPHLTIGLPFMKWIEESDIQWDKHPEPCDLETAMMKLLEMETKPSYEPEIIDSFYTHWIRTEDIAAATRDAAGSYLHERCVQQEQLWPHDLFIPTAIYFLARYVPQVQLEVQFQDAVVAMLDDLPRFVGRIALPWAWHRARLPKDEHWRKDIRYFLRIFNVLFRGHDTSFQTYLNKVLAKGALRGRRVGSRQRRRNRFSIRSL